MNRTAASGRCAATRSTSRRRSLFCWVAADRGRGSHACAATTTAAERWEAAAQEMHDDICANGTDDRGVFVQHYETDALDASLLLLPLIRFLPPPTSACAPPS